MVQHLRAVTHGFSQLAAPFIVSPAQRSTAWQLVAALLHIERWLLRSLKYHYSYPRPHATPSREAGESAIFPHRCPCEGVLLGETHVSLSQPVTACARACLSGLGGRFANPPSALPGGSFRTRGLLIANQARCHCATSPFGSHFFAGFSFVARCLAAASPFLFSRLLRFLALRITGDPCGSKPMVIVDRLEVI